MCDKNCLNCKYEDCIMPDTSYDDSKKSYYEKNREKILAKKKEYDAKNSEKIKAYQKEYREKNKEKLKAKRKLHYENNKDKYKNYYLNRKKKEGA